ncbi:MAG: hypothetical protein IJB64_09975 [Akkermansia sp.]|nr:hypothetical protein [Akkermansia sp.]
MIDGKSHLIASEMNDIFARIGWHRAGFTAMATDRHHLVGIQYRSPKYGKVRIVNCDALGLTKWLKPRAGKPGCRAEFETLLDRKESAADTPVQQMLDLSEPLARRAMRPS